MATTRKHPIRRFFRRLLLALAAPVVSVEVPGDTRFPTRTIEEEDFRFDPTTGLIHRKGTGATEPYSLTIDGMVEKPTRLTYQDLRSLPAVTQVSDFHCVEGWSILRIRWTGIRFQELINLVKPLEGADHAVFHSLGRTRSAPEGQEWYIESFSVTELLDPKEEILLVYDLDGKPLPHDRGAPLRVIAPLRQAYKSSKFVQRVEFTNEAQQGWWTLANPIYDAEARVPRHRLRRE